VTTPDPESPATAVPHARPHQPDQQPAAMDGQAPRINVRAPAARRAIRYEQATIGYNILEGIIAVTAGLVAGAIALVGFGFDSWIEVAAATVVLVRLRAELRGGQADEAKQRRALRFVAVTFFVLATYVPSKASATWPVTPDPTPA
jgi:hypothetical protein